MFALHREHVCRSQSGWQIFELFRERSADVPTQCLFGPRLQRTGRGRSQTAVSFRTQTLLPSAARFQRNGKGGNAKPMCSLLLRIPRGVSHGLDELGHGTLGPDGLAEALIRHAVKLV